MLFKSQKDLEKVLFKILNSDILPLNSYLAGGTAIYFYLKHRLSIDLDFFSSSKFNNDFFLSDIKKIFKHVQVELIQKNTIILYLTKDKIKFSLFNYPYSLLDKINYFELGKKIKCPVTSIFDLELMKTIAINQRGLIKDFVDLFFLLEKTNHNYNNIFNGLKDKFSVDNNFNYQLKTSFIYFDDADIDTDSILMINRNQNKISDTEWNKIKQFFKDFIK